MFSSDKTLALIESLSKAASDIGFTVEQYGEIGGYPLLGMSRTGSGQNDNGQQIYLSSGIHGDEPAGPQASLELLQNDSLPRIHSYCICPLINPVGLSRGTRDNADGIDLNRDYRNPVSDEIDAHTKWIERNVRDLCCAFHLHEDWESKGFYLYELNFSNESGLSDKIIQATRKYLPTETAEKIDGRLARRGVIRPESLPELEEGDPEAIYIQKNYGGLNYTLETPSSADFRLRVEALKTGVLATL